jgi:IS1 family transposase
MTIVDRETHCFLAIEAVVYRNQETAQRMVNQTPAQQYYSDQFPLYDSLRYRRGCHLSLADKSETYSVEGGNADLRHYLTRLAQEPLLLSLSRLVESSSQGFRPCLEPPPAPQSSSSL